MDVNLNEFNEINELRVIESNSKNDGLSFYEIVKLVSPLVIFTIVFGSVIRIVSFYLGIM